MLGSCLTSLIEGGEASWNLVEHHQSDASAIERSLTRPAEFDVILDRYYDELYAFLAGATGPEAAEDLAQIVFLTAFDRRHRFRSERVSARPWIYGIARNVLRRWYRSNSRRQRALDRWGRSARPVTEFESEAAGRLSIESTRQQLRSALEQLSRRDREVLLLRGLAGLTYEEISEALGIPIGTVRSRLHRSRQQLRSLLGEAGASNPWKEVEDEHG